MKAQLSGYVYWRIVLGVANLLVLVKKLSLLENMDLFLIHGQIIPDASWSRICLRSIDLDYVMYYIYMDSEALMMHNGIS